MYELSLAGENLIYDVRGGEPPRKSTLRASDMGLEAAPRAALRGGSVAENVTLLRDIVQGRVGGPQRDVVLLNAAAALVAGDLAGDFAEGLRMAQKSIDEGRAAARLDRMVAVSQGAA